MREQKLFDYIGKITPLITEKALKASENSVVVFKTPKHTAKGDVKKIIEKLYKGSKVLKINSTLVKGKVKKFKGRIGKRADYKKFYVKLEKPIDITTGIK
jgi:large subunit ribosomal protein L23